jgi:hypothetical protein
MKKLSNLIALTCFLLICGCSTGHLHKKSSLLNYGDTKEVVTKRLGPDEAWQYCETGQFSDDFLMVQFGSSKVTAVKTYQNTTGFAPCSGFF